jgi:hypothetical protein
LRNWDGLFLDGVDRLVAEMSLLAVYWQ